MFEQKEWSLKELLPSTSGEEFDKILKELNEKVDKFVGCRTKLDSLSRQEFFELIKLSEEIVELKSRISGYAGLWFSEDTSSQDARSFMQKIDELNSDLSNKCLFFNLWFVQLNDQKADEFIKDPGEYEYFLKNLRKFKPHVLSEKEEQIINVKDITGKSALDTIYSIITNGFEYKIKIDGQNKKLTQEELTSLVRNPKPELRKTAYKTLLKTYSKHNDVLGEIYKNLVLDWKNESIKFRKYNSPIDVRNKANDIPEEVVNALINVCKKNINIFQEYFVLKAKLLGVEKLERYHLYAPLKEIDKNFPFNEGVDLVFQAFDSFSPELGNLIKKVFEDNHLHSTLKKNKRSGAFCSSLSPKITPFVLMNYTGKYRDVETLAHELGHALHSLLASHNSILTFEAPLPLAETASIFAEMLLTDLMLSKETDNELKKDLLASKLDNIYASIIRQIFFIDFEIKAHNAIANNVTVKELNELYLNNLKEQFGKSVKVSKDFQIEWTYIPHIYHTPFYCYAYAFGNLLTLALYDMYKKEGKSFVDKYKQLLASGGSQSPEQILSKLGIDIKSESFWQKGFEEIKLISEELKKKLNKLKI